MTLKQTSVEEQKNYKEKNKHKLLVLSVFCEANMADNINAKTAGIQQRNLLNLREDVLNCSS